MTSLDKYIVLLVSILAAAHSKTIRQNDNAKDELEKYIEEKRQEINQRYRLQYHVAGPVGWINDPNGFSFYKGEYHLFFQFYPYDSVWGPMHWGHVSSPDLVNWKQLPTALLPEKEQCFSGSAVVEGDRMILIYTGHEITATEPFYNETQYLAFSDDGVEFTKYEGNPVIPAAPNGSPDFRDPKAWRHEDNWYVIIGSKTLDGRGRVILYRSKDMISWEFLRVLGEATGNMGYMWECPDFFQLGEKYILLMSPQGMEPVGDRYKNLHQTGYIIGDFNYDTFEFVPEVGFQELDYGHDIYAAQTTEESGKRYLVAWFNMWEAPHPEETDGWCGGITIVRELELVGNRIHMKPVDAMVSLRDGSLMEGYFQAGYVRDFDQTVEIIVNGSLKMMWGVKFEGRDGGGKVTLRWDPDDGKVSVDRGLGDIRQVEWNPKGSYSWRIFLDASSLELFCGDGEAVFSSRVYPDGGWRMTIVTPQYLYIEAYKLKRSVPV